MRPMEPILAYTSLLALCYLVTLVKAENSENVTAPSSSRNKRSLTGEFRPRNLVGTLIHQGRRRGRKIVAVSDTILH